MPSPPTTPRQALRACGHAFHTLLEMADTLLAGRVGSPANNAQRAGAPQSCRNHYGHNPCLRRAMEVEREGLEPPARVFSVPCFEWPSPRDSGRKPRR
jgi:hypothetical protein